MAQHARLPASAAKRWRTCPGSVRLSRDLPPGASSEYAMEGTAAHFVLQQCLEDAQDPSFYLGSLVHVDPTDAHPTTMTIAGAAILKTRDFRRRGYHAFEVDDEMVDGLRQVIAEGAAILERLGPGAEQFTERYFDLSHIDPRLGGTGDWTLVEPFGDAHLIDLKWGKGVLVEATDNDQQKTYAVGVVTEHPDVERVWVWIAQPRVGHADGWFRTHEVDGVPTPFTRRELLEFGAQLKRDADATDDPDAPLVPGDHCVFCPVKSSVRGCPALDARVLETAVSDFFSEPAPPEVPTDPDRLSAVAGWLPMVEAWVAGCNDAVLAHMLNGGKIADHKLVRKRKHRRWLVEPDEVVGAVVGAGLDRSKAFKPERLESPAAVERLGPALKAFARANAAAPEGEVTVARASDPRPEVDPTRAVQDDFAEEIEAQAEEAKVVARETRSGHRNDAPPVRDPPKGAGRKPCGRCKGTGAIGDELCPRCNGDCYADQDQG